MKTKIYIIGLSIIIGLIFHLFLINTEIGLKVKDSMQTGVIFSDQK